MQRHECSRDGIERTAVAVCPSCSVGLCKDHPLAAFRSTTATLYACEHQPERPFVPTRVGLRSGMGAAVADLDVRANLSTASEEPS